MKPSIQILGQILYTPAQYVIPVFQRNYRWERPQWEKLWESLQEVQSPDKRGNHFMGFLVFVPGLAQPGQHIRFHLIDGQQRLTTCSILLVALRNVARRHHLDELADEVHAYYLVHPPKKNDEHYRVLPKERDHDAYIAIVDGSTTGGRIADALAYFEEQCESVAQKGVAQLHSVFNTVCQRLEFMCATLEAENAYNIFKSLNSTGVPLGQADLIRNFVFMHVRPDDQDEFDRKHWGPLEDGFTKADGSFDESAFSSFFRDYLMSSGKYISPKDTFSSFESRFESTDFSPQDLARRLIQSGVNYAIISGREPDRAEAVTSALKGLNQLDSSTTYPLLLALFDQRDAGALDDARLARAIEMLAGFILRRFICGESSRGYGQMFVRALSNAEGDPLATLEDYLLKRGWPDDRKFSEAFVSFPIYQRQYAREVLEALEHARGHKEQADLQNAQIEHIMPQTMNDQWRSALGPNHDRIHADWLHCPGNLTLSGYNLELWNHSFGVKRARYGQSNVVLTRELADYEQWTDTQIRQRGRQMSNAAATIWIGPRDPLPETVPEAHASRFVLRSKFWTGLQAFLKARAVDLPPIEPAPNMHTTIASTVKHVGVRLRYNLNQSSVAIVVWFWGRSGREVWDAIRAAPQEYDQKIGLRWQFSEIPGRTRARMKVEMTGLQLRDEAQWPNAFEWFAAKLPLLYSKVLPVLGEKLGMRGVAAQRLEREDLDPAQAMTAACESEEERAAVLRELLASIETAARLAPRACSVTLFRDGFRLNVGQVEALTIGPGYIRMLVHGQLPDEVCAAGEMFDVDYRNAPSPSQAVVLPRSAFLRLSSLIRPAHQKYVRAAAVTPEGKPRRSSFARHHSVELIEYARQFVGADAPA